ncbi:MAG: permease [Bacteroidales bacterium]|nr:permease [Bacteroidales bacterium]
MELFISYFEALKLLMLDMSPWLVLGFFIAGLLHVFFPDGKINNILGRSNMKSVIRAALIGIPLPLCSCGVIPAGISIYKNGASKGASVSFLISTPQTGVDSILVTYSMLGLPFAIIRPFVALATGIFGGFFTNKTEISQNAFGNSSQKKITNKKSRKNIFVSIFRYAFVDFLQDISKWLIIGLLIAALIAVLVPDDFFASYIHNDFFGMLIILAASVPMYVCATSSVPIAAVLLMKGISPGAALVFLMAGPATNAATISVIGKSMGRKTLFVYLTTIITGAMLSGMFIDYLLPGEWFALPHHMHGHRHEHSMLPQWIHIASALLLLAFIVHIYIRKYYYKLFGNHQQIKTTMGDMKIFVRGMNCNHCKTSVENNLSKLDGIESVSVDLDSETVSLKGKNIDWAKVKATVEGIGYRYEEIGK